MTADDATTRVREALKSVVAGKPCDTGVLADAILATLPEHRDDVLDVLGMRVVTTMGEVCTADPGSLYAFRPKEQP